MEPDAHSLGRLIGVDQAIAIIDAVPLEPIITIDVDLTLPEEQMTANVLAVDVFADRDQPPFDKSLVDGFAVRAADTGSGSPLSLVGEIAAGAVATQVAIQHGEAIAIMTGAPIPEGADAVIPVEESTVAGEEVHFKSPEKAGRFITVRGADVRAGDLVLPKGTVIGPAQLAVLASVGVTHAPVIGDPIVHVLVTGDEIVGSDEIPALGQIRDSNGPMLVSLLRHLQTMPRASRVGDCRDSIKTAIDGIVAEADVLLVSGGMSMGTHDHVPSVLAELGFELRITKLRIKPGKPFVFATRTRPGKLDYVFGLPGNPVSGFVCTLRLVSRLIARLRGLPPADNFVHAALSADLPANGPREFYQPAILKDGVAKPLDWRGSADIFTLAKADALIVRPADEPARTQGETVRAILIPR